MLTKISICLFLLRIVDSKRVKRGMYTLIGFTVLFTAISVFLFLGVCRPLKAYWDVGVNGACLSNHQVKSVVLAQGSESTALDRIGMIAKPDASLISRYRSGSRCDASNFFEKPSDQYADQGGAVHAYGFRCHVRKPCSCSHVTR